MLSMLQSYSKFYNEQNKDLENDLISSKIDLANKKSLLDEYQNNKKKLIKKLNEILKNYHFQFESINFSKNKNKNLGKSKSQKEFFKNNIEILKIRSVSFEFRNEKENELKESKFFYKMSLLQFVHKNSSYSFNNKPHTAKSGLFSQKAISNEAIQNNSQLRRKTISIVMSHFKRSPSILLNNINDLTEKNKEDEKSIENWEKNIIGMIKSKQNREKILKEIQSAVKKSHIPSKLRGIIWPFVIK